jgi:hypothetical protein
MSTPMDRRGRNARAATNQMLFRAFDVRVHALNRHMDFIAQVGDWICECGMNACSERIEMSVHDYEAIHRHGGQFFVAPSDEHFRPEVERVIEHHERYWVVETTGFGGTPADRDERHSYSEPLSLHT